MKELHWDNSKVSKVLQGSTMHWPESCCWFTLCKGKTADRSSNLPLIHKVPAAFLDSCLIEYDVISLIQAQVDNRILASVCLEHPLEHPCADLEDICQNPVGLHS